MKLRTRVALATALVTAVAVLVVSFAAWFLANRALRDTVDDQLDQRAEALDPSAGRRRGSPFLAGDVNVQFLDRSGTVIQFGELSIDVTAGDVAVAQTGKSKERRDATATTADGDELRVRVLTVPINLELRPPGGSGRQAPELSGAVMLARPLNEIEESLDRLQVALVVLSLAGVAAAGGIGLLIGSRSVRPVARLRDAAGEVSRTGALDTEIPVEREDELGSLARSFNSMLAALHESKQQQERLIYDASHELRTPLTSLRTNVELLQRAESMPADQRRPVLDDVLSELDELTTLVTELVELATDQHRSEDTEPVRLSSIVELVVDRHRRRSGLEISFDGDDSVVLAVPGLVERAVSNLVENAVKFSPRDGEVKVTTEQGVVVVSDQGPGIAPDDRVAVFERFWRAPQARTLPGSGLGLSIVERVAKAHGGSVEVGDSELGGATFVLRFPLAPANQ